MSDKTTEMPLMNPSTPAEIERAKIAGWWAVINYRPRDTCPFSDNDPLRNAWLEGWDSTFKRLRW